MTEFTWPTIHLARDIMFGVALCGCDSGIVGVESPTLMPIGQGGSTSKHIVLQQQAIVPGQVLGVAGVIAAPKRILIVD